MIARYAASTAILTVACALGAAHASPSQSIPAQRPSKAIVVVANRTVLEDIDLPSLPNISRMLNTGAVGLISPNCVGYRSDGSVLFTAGAGAGCRAGSYAQEIYDVDEPVPSDSKAGDAYKARTGWSAPPGSAVFLALGPTLRANADMDARPAQLGAMGEALHGAGRKTCAIGNADVPPNAPDRSAAVLAMDSRGLIDVGRLQLGGGEDSGACGLQPDVDRLVRDVRRCLPEADFLVVNYGYTTRLDEQQSSLSDPAFASRRQTVIRGLDSLIGELAELSDNEDAVLILVSFSPPKSQTGRRLTPIAIYAPGARQRLLFSPTTRTRGLIAATDFAPTVLELMGVAPQPGMLGRRASMVGATEGALGAVREIDARVVAHRALVAPVLWVFIVLGGLAFCGPCTVIAFSLSASPRVKAVLKVLLLVIVYVPLAALIAVLAPPGALNYGIAMAVAFAALIAAALVIGSRYPTRPGSHLLPAPVLIAFALSVTGILIDSALGGRLCRYALPSSYQLSGLRYYGIGNEYAGTLLPMMAVLALYLATRTRPGRWTAPALGIVTVAFFGLGRLGANYGATVAAVITFSLLITAIWRGSYGGRHVLGSLALGIVLVILLAVADSRIAGLAGSHAGRLANLVGDYGGWYVVSIALRKLLLNMRMLFSMDALKAYLGYLPVTVLWFWGIQWKAKKRVIGDKRVFAGLKAVLLGTAFALVLNDSGSVMASIMMVMLTSMVLYALLDEQPEREDAAERLEGTRACHES